MTAPILQTVTATVAVVDLAQEVECEEVKDYTRKCKVGECSKCKYKDYQRRVTAKGTYVRSAYLSCETVGKVALFSGFA